MDVGFCKICTREHQVQNLRWANCGYVCTKDGLGTAGAVPEMSQLWIGSEASIWSHGSAFEKGARVLNVQQMEALGTGSRVSSPEIILFLKHHQFEKCFHLIFLFVMGYNNISRKPSV